MRQNRFSKEVFDNRSWQFSEFFQQCRFRAAVMCEQRFGAFKHFVKHCLADGIDIFPATPYNILLFNCLLRQNDGVLAKSYSLDPSLFHPPSEDVNYTFSRQLCFSCKITMRPCFVCFFLHCLENSFILALFISLQHRLLH